MRAPALLRDLETSLDPQTDDTEDASRPNTATKDTGLDFLADVCVVEGIDETGDDVADGQLVEGVNVDPGLVSSDNGGGEQTEGFQAIVGGELEAQNALLGLEVLA